MRHLKKGRKFGRIRNQRVALFKTLLGSLIMKGKIETTETKAKELKIRIDKVITKAKKSNDSPGKVIAYRSIKKDIPEQASKKLMSDVLDRFSKRSSGYARIIRLNPRKSDGARMAVIEFVD